MQVIRASFESTVNNAVADMVQQEMDGLQLKSVPQVICAPVNAVTVRVMAAAAHAFWICNEVVLFFPRMIGIAVGLAISHGGVNPTFFGRAAVVYGLYFKTTGAQFVLGSLACVAPEVSHWGLQLHKSLFNLQVETFVQSLPDLPHVQRESRKYYAYVDSLVELFLRMEITDEEWREALILAIQDDYKTRPHLGPKFLTCDSELFQDAFVNTVCQLSALKLNELQANATLSNQLLSGLQRNIWVRMNEFLAPDTQKHLRQVVRENSSHEVYVKFLHELGFTYQEDDTVGVLKMLLEKMKEARQPIIDSGKCTQDNIECCEPEAITFMMFDGLVRLLDAATLSQDDPPAISFGEITFSEDKHFFNVKKLLVEAKQKLDLLSAKDPKNPDAKLRVREQLFQLCCDPSQVVAEDIRECYDLVQSVGYDVLIRKMHNQTIVPEFQVNWAEAFVF